MTGASSPVKVNFVPGVSEVRASRLPMLAM